jgi:hypothetical protein
MIANTWLALIFINSLFIIGLYEATESGRILAGIHDFLENYLPDLIYKPLLGCVYCMASVWGSALFLVYYYPIYTQNYFLLGWLLVHIGGVSGLNYFLYEMILFFRRPSS